jgi:hypothetical protein
MRRVDIPYFETGPLSRKAAGAQGAQTALMGHFRQRVDLVHELRKLAASEEIPDLVA